MTAPDVVEIEASRRELGCAFALALIMAAAGVFVAMNPLLDGPVTRTVGYATAALFGAAMVVALRRLSERGPVITITPAGICDRRVAPELIPWSAIHDIGVWEYRGQALMVLAIDPLVEAGLSLTARARWARGPNRAVGADGLCVTAHGLKIGFAELVRTSVAYWQFSRNGAG